MNNRLCNIPSVGIIPDGNRRWAQKNNTEYLVAYMRAMEVLEMSIREFNSLSGTVNFVIYMLSHKNLSRQNDDLEAVLLAESNFFNIQLNELSQEIEARIIPVGLENLHSPGLSIINEYINALKHLEQRSMHYSQCNIYILAGYDPFWEIHKAINGSQFSKIDINSLLVPIKLDLILRTSGEWRLSDFVPLQSGYAELIFVDKLFPEMSRKDIEHTINTYAKRNRRMGL